MTIVECPRCTAEFDPLDYELEQKPKRIDIGCGATLKRAAPGYDVYTDIVECDLDLPGKYVRCAMEKMPFANKEFEYARCHHVIEHTEDPAEACSELIRIAKAGVRSFVFAVLSGWNMMSLTAIILGNRWSSARKLKAVS